MKPYIEISSAAGLEWVKSSYSGNNGDCVEVAELPTGGRAVRDSKNPGGPALTFTVEEWNAFAADVAGGGLGFGRS
ncbi:DUF397 domain-containing protein [Streptomyces polygonati]|jgi:hypothetical protein|uniref:DUF397 domain-containing protein n=1 Tax=Streptomyces polygonati TaxID=1617087 RepID=A0ABV8I0Y5_9ACTN